MGDDARSGVSAENLKLPLEQSWVHQPLLAPRPAWRGPAKRDMYNKVGLLKNRQLFDHAFHVIADAKHVYFGSSADDQVHCLDLNSGEERWSFFTEGPVRFAPVANEGSVYFGSDDGYVYCVDATTGKLRWKFYGHPEGRADRNLLGNRRLIPMWPVRGGPTLHNGVIYFAAGLWPEEGIFVHGVDAKTGVAVWTNSDSAVSYTHLTLPTKA